MQTVGLVLRYIIIYPIKFYFRNFLAITFEILGCVILFAKAVCGNKFYTNHVPLWCVKEGSSSFK